MSSGPGGSPEPSPPTPRGLVAGFVPHVVGTALVAFSMQLPAQASSVAVARAALEGLHSWVSRPRLRRLELITSEAVTNAIRHGSPHAGDVVQFDVAVDADQAVASVLDSGAPFRFLGERPEPGRIGGFGLLVIDDLASWWHIEHTGSGNRVSYAV